MQNMTVMVLPFRSAGFRIIQIFTNDELHEAFAAEEDGDDLDGHAVLPHQDGAISHNAAERRVAGAHFLGDIDTATPNPQSSRQGPLGRNSALPLASWIGPNAGSNGGAGNR